MKRYKLLEMILAGLMGACSMPDYSRLQGTGRSDLGSDVSMFDGRKPDTRGSDVFDAQLYDTKVPDKGADRYIGADRVADDGVLADGPSYDSPRDGGVDAPPDGQQDVESHDGRLPDALAGDTLAGDASLPDVIAPSDDTQTGSFPEAGIRADAGPLPDVLPDAFPDVLPDLLPDVGTGLPDEGIDATLTCSGGAPFNSLQSGVCAGSLQRCDSDTRSWVDDYTSVAGYETIETRCDGLDNDCNTRTDENLLRPSRECRDGIGGCERIGREYQTCLGVNGWSADYSDCDAVAADPQPELCNGIDDDCNGELDAIEIIDDFNRPDRDRLGENAFGNPWTEYGELDDWDIVGNTAETSWTGGPGSNPRVSSDIGYHDRFNLLVKFRLSSVGPVGSGALWVGVNCHDGQTDGLVARIAVGNGDNHYISRAGPDVDVSSGEVSLQASVDYQLRFAYDGTNLRAKLWEDGTPEPDSWTLEAAVANVNPDQTYMTLTGDLNSGQVETTTLDYIVDECE